MKSRILILFFGLWILVGCAPAVPTETEPPTEISEPVSESIPESETESETIPESETESETEWEPQWHPADPKTWTCDPTDPETWVHEAALLSDSYRQKFFYRVLYAEEYKEREQLSHDELVRCTLIPAKIYASYFHVGMTMEDVDKLLPKYDWGVTRFRVGSHVYIEDDRHMSSTMFHLFIDMSYRYVVLEYTREGVVNRVTVYDDLPRNTSYEVMKNCSAGMSLYEVLEIAGFPTVSPGHREYAFTNCYFTLVFENGELIDTFSRLLPHLDEINPNLKKSSDRTPES